MKRIISLILALALCLTLSACGKEDNNTTEIKPTEASEIVTNEVAAPQIDLANFPYIGTWTNDGATIYMRIQDGGQILSESVVTSQSTSTVNGVTTSSTSKSVISNTYSWSVENNKFLFNGVKAYTPSIENDQYCLVSDSQTFYRVGDLDFVIPLVSDEDADKKDIKEDSVEYVLGTPIIAEGFELILEECGIKDDIRISSNSSGIKITAGPSVEDGKQYVYLKGTLKNTGHTSTREVIGGVVYLDEYEFNLRTDTIRTSGNPASTIDPLETVHILLFAQITDEMAGLFNEGKIVFGFNDNFTNVELEKAQYLYYTNIVR